MGTVLTFRVSNPPSGLNVRFCEQARDILLLVSQRWSMIYEPCNRVLRIGPAGGDGYLISQREKDNIECPYRISFTEEGTSDLLPLFGRVEFTRRAHQNFSQGLEFTLPERLPPPRILKQVAQRRARAPDERYQVLICRPGEPDALFSVPANEIHEQMVEWWRAGWAVDDD